MRKHARLPAPCPGEDEERPFCVLYSVKLGRV
jgi:hypothetical protein